MAEDRYTEPRVMSARRMEALSDGVFAIAITLLVLEIGIPSGATDLLTAFWHEWPSYLAYVISFATIGGVWLGHNVITDYLAKADSRLMRLNLLLLMVIAFLPFPTRLLAEYIRHDEPERVAATIYGLTLLASTSFVSGMWRYAIHRGLISASADDGDVQLLTRRLTPSLAGYVVLIAIGLFLPRVAVFGYLLMAIGFLLPMRGSKANRGGGHGQR